LTLLFFNPAPGYSGSSRKGHLRGRGPLAHRTDPGALRKRIYGL
jgi:hypothetical protein